MDRQLSPRDGKEPSLLGFGSVRVLQKNWGSVQFEFLASTKTVGSVLFGFYKKLGFGSVRVLCKHKNSGFGSVRVLLSRQGFSSVRFYMGSETFDSFN